jgi:Protein of unknown function (DUF2721)
LELQVLSLQFLSHDYLVRDIMLCMEISLTTPALLFPAISLLMLAYTNRFLTLATIIRGLHDRYKSEANDNLLGQIANLRYRVYLIRNMQIFGVLSLLFCVISMFALFAGWIAGGQWTFAIALILMMVSMLTSLRELQISVGALDLLLVELEEEEKKG